MKKRNSKPSEELYQPLKILDERDNGKEKQFLIKWKGYDDSESTWEPLQNIQHCLYLFDKWKKNKESIIQKELENAKKIIDKRYQGSKVQYLVKWKDGKPDSWIYRKDLVANHSDKIKEYSRLYGLVQKRKYEEMSSDEDSVKSDEDKEEVVRENSEENKSDDSSSDIEKQDYIEKQSDQTVLDNKSNSNQEESNVTRRIVKVKRQMPSNQQFKYASGKINYNKLPRQGILGIDEPFFIFNMTIDKRIGDKNDNYFSCDITWRVRPNKNQPLDSRVSRQDLKDGYPLLLIQFYEENMTYEGKVIDSNDEESESEDYIQFGYAKQPQTTTTDQVAKKQVTFGKQ